MKNIIAITMGDPKGIGPEVVAKAWASLSEPERKHIRIYGDRAVLSAAAELAGTEFDPKQLVITSSITPPIIKITDQEAARTTLAALDAAQEDIAQGAAGALITAPVNKVRLQMIAKGFLGHTEYLAHAAHARNPVMMFASERAAAAGEDGPTRHLCVALVTMHKALKDVPTAITKDRILATIRRTHEALDSYFACPEPRIAVMSLNPHAGEGGALGTEEQTTIIPALERARKEGINCVGPLAADGLFAKLGAFDYDAIVAMYHDQGLIPVKMMGVHHAVNITLGLPYIRTSPAHGTAEDIAWLGHAEGTGMLTAIRLTRKIMGWRVEDS